MFFTKEGTLEKQIFISIIIRVLLILVFYVYCFCLFGPELRAEQEKTNTGGTTSSPDSLLKNQVLDSTEKAIYIGNTLESGYDIGVDTDKNKTDWLMDSERGYMTMSYPEGQKWGAVFITVGPAQSDPEERESEDFSGYKYIAVDLKGKVGGETLEIGLKDKHDPDNGREKKLKINNLTNEWQSYQFELTKFHTADLKTLYVVTEFVFTGPQARTVQFRNIKFLR